MPKKSESPISVEQIGGMTRTMRRVRVMLDRDLRQDARNAPWYP
jgi:hypothetical protein